MSKPGQLSKDSSGPERKRILTHEQAREALASKLQNTRTGSTVVRGEMFVQHTGPLPHPETLRAYGEILPDMPERIMAMAEREQKHRHEVDRVGLKLHAGAIARGQWFAAGIGFAGIAGGILLLMFDKPISGFVTLLGTVGTLVGLFFYGEKQKRQASEQPDAADRAS